MTGPFLSSSFKPLPFSWLIRPPEIDRLRNSLCTHGHDCQIVGDELLCTFNISWLLHHYMCRLHGMPLHTLLSLSSSTGRTRLVEVHNLCCFACLPCLRLPIIYQHYPPTFWSPHPLVQLLLTGHLHGH